MGTRSLICIFYNGRFVVAQYAQYDGYPEGEGQGMKILKFLLDSANIERLKDGLQHIRTRSREEAQRPEDNLQRDMDDGGSEPVFCQCAGQRNCAKCETEGIWHSLSRYTGGGILEIIAQATAEKWVPVVVELEFANDGLYCEWAYVVDLDNCVFEIFAGAVGKDKAVSKRFADVGEMGDTVPALVKSYSFAELPANEAVFIGALNKVMDCKQWWIKV